MYVAEIVYPGTWLDIEDKDLAFEIEGMLRHLVDLVTEAAITLTMFLQSRAVRSDPKADRERDAAIRAEIDGQLRAEVGDLYYCDFNRYRLESDRRVRAKKAELGIAPRLYIHKMPFIHAHSFVYAVDSFGKFLDEICEYEIVPKELANYRDEFNNRLSAVRKIRNSALHIEDRLRRYASWKDKKQGKRMKVDGFLGLSNLENNDLCYTIDDGSYQRVSISIKTLLVLVEVANRVLAAFPWRGPRRLEPDY